MDGAFDITGQTEKMYQMIGARNGVGITIDGSVVEIYEFDTTIGSGREMLSNLQKEGFMGQRVDLVHGNIAVIMYDHEKSEVVAEIIKRL